MKHAASTADRHQEPPRRTGRPRAFERGFVLNRALEVFWSNGYEPTSISQLCAAMGINSPSLYATFGSKSRLFLEAIQHYEAVYWNHVWRQLADDADLHCALRDFFRQAAGILTHPEAPCGCLVVLGATNVSARSPDVQEALKYCRLESKSRFRERLARGKDAGQLPADANLDVLASVLATLLQGMSIQARDLASCRELEDIATSTLSMIPGSRFAKRTAMLICTNDIAANR